MNFIQRHLFFASLSLIIFIGGQYLYYSYAPVDWWFKYLEITPVEPARAGEDILFLSRIEARSEATVRWVDVLRCRRGQQGYREAGRQQTTGRIRTPQKKGGEHWFFKSNGARSGDICYLDSVTFLQLPFGIERPAPFESERKFLVFE